MITPFSALDLVRIELRVAQHVDEDVERDVRDLGGALDVVPGVLLAVKALNSPPMPSISMEMSRARSACAQSLEEHVLREMRDAVRLGVS